MKKIRALIIDDERAARNEIKRLLANYPNFELAGEASNADEAAGNDNIAKAGSAVPGYPDARKIGV
jgi:DNA-binding NarL/FixJ family response regulator